MKVYSLATLISIFLLAISCEKYENGGAVRKAEKRLTEHGWILDSYWRNGNDETSKLIIGSLSEVFDESGQMTRSYIDGDGEPFSETGSWQFDDDKQQINLTGIGSIELTDETSTVSTSDYNIRKLDKEELWYSYENGGGFSRIPFQGKLTTI